MVSGAEVDSLCWRYLRPTPLCCLETLAAGGSASGLGAALHLSLENRYLGRAYRLKAVQGKEESVTLTRSLITVQVRDKSNAACAKALLEKWTRHQAEVLFAE